MRTISCHNIKEQARFLYLCSQKEDYNTLPYATILSETW